MDYALIKTDHFVPLTNLLICDLILTFALLIHTSLKLLIQYQYLQVYILQLKDNRSFAADDDDYLYLHLCGN